MAQDLYKIGYAGCGPYAAAFDPQGQPLRLVKLNKFGDPRETLADIARIIRELRDLGEVRLARGIGEVRLGRGSNGCFTSARARCETLEEQAFDMVDAEWPD